MFSWREVSQFTRRFLAKINAMKTVFVVWAVKDYEKQKIIQSPNPTWLIVHETVSAGLHENIEDETKTLVKATNPPPKTCLYMYFNDNYCDSTRTFCIYHLKDLKVSSAIVENIRIGRDRALPAVCFNRHPQNRLSKSDHAVRSDKEQVESSHSYVSWLLIDLQQHQSLPNNWNSCHYAAIFYLILSISQSPDANLAPKSFTVSGHTYEDGQPRSRVNQKVGWWAGHGRGRQGFKYFQIFSRTTLKLLTSL